MAATVPPPRRQPSGRIRAGIARRKGRTLRGIDRVRRMSVKRWDPDNFSADLRGANGQAGLAWSWLDYRHNFGSHLALRGVSLYKIATLMGNSPEICRRHCAALVPETMAEEVEIGRLDAVMSLRTA